jgi:hypothetical protein
MSTQILYMTEHLYNQLSVEQRQSFEKACQLAQFQLDFKHSDSKFLKNVKSPNVIIGGEQCLVNLLEKEKFHPKANFILFGVQKDEIKVEKYKNQLKDVRFIIGDLALPLLEMILVHTLCFFKNKNQPSITSQLNQSDSITLSFELKNSKERDEMQQKISDFFKAQIDKNKGHLTIGASVYAKNLADILEEFLMNAIWDANPKYAQEDRTKPIELLESERVNIFCLFDGINLILSVTDLFGSFASSAIEKHILYTLGYKGDNKVNEETTRGAGIGLFMILQKIGLLIFEVEKGKATRATAIARGDQSLRDMQKKSRTLLFYEKD